MSITSEQRQWVNSAMAAVDHADGAHEWSGEFSLAVIAAHDDGGRGFADLRARGTVGFDELASELNTAARELGITLPPRPGGGGSRYERGPKQASAKQIALVFKLRKAAGLPRGAGPATSKAASEEIDRLISASRQRDEAEGATGPQIRKIAVMRKILAGQGKSDPTQGAHPRTKREASEFIGQMIEAEKSPRTANTPLPTGAPDHTPDPEDFQSYIDAHERDNAPEAWLADQQAAPEDQPDPPARQVAVDVPEESGVEPEENRFFMLDGEPVLVSRSKSSGHLYGRKRVAGEKGWTYVPGAITGVRKRGTEATLSEAAAHSAHLGYCLACGRELTAKKSALEGIGPVCRKKFRT